jgi:5-methylcytosine-specific restriction endonuclease McrA
MSPWRAPKLCAVAGCSRLTHERHCPAHKRQKERQHNQKRGAAINSWTRQKIKERDGHRCRLCGSPGPLQVHHITPVAAGGDKTAEDNLITLCAACHQRQHRS